MLLDNVSCALMPVHGVRSFMVLIASTSSPPFPHVSLSQHLFYLQYTLSSHLSTYLPFPAYLPLRFNPIPR